MHSGTGDAEEEVGAAFRLADPGQGERVKSECRMKDYPEMIRPRELVDQYGVEQVGNDILLALLLRTGTTQANVLDVARSLMRRYGSLKVLASTSVADICKVKGISRVKAQIIKAALELGMRVRSEQSAVQIKQNTPQSVYELMRDRASVQDHESFWVLILNKKNILKCAPLEVTSGILDASLVHPREVFREAVRLGAAAVILVHNHPSGDPHPSAEDLRITRQMVEAGKILTISVLDHVIIGQGQPNNKNFVSLRESGMVTF